MLKFHIENYDHLFNAPNIPVERTAFGHRSLWTLGVANKRHSMLTLRKTQSHGRIGEAAVTAKCWMNGVPAHNTNGLRANFAGSDLIADTPDPRRKLLIQVKTGYAPTRGKVYLTQASGEADLTDDKFHADYVVFVNIDKKAGGAHAHDGTLDFSHFTYYVVPAEIANTLFRAAVRREFDRPLLKTGGNRKLANLQVNVEYEALAQYKDAWALLHAQARSDA